MAHTPPPTLTPAPTPAPQRGDRATFSDRVDAFVTWLTAAVAEFQGVASNVYANALDAYASATSALGAKTAAESARDAAQAARDTAQTYRDTAQTYRDQAAASATAAANSAAALTATSATDQTLVIGTKTFTDIPAGKQFSVNVPIIAVDQTNPANYLYGTVAAYVAPNLQIAVTKIGGTPGATVSDWNIAVSGVQGAQGNTGGIAGGSMTGALNFAKAADVASAATPDIWSGAGNYEVITGTTTITGFTDAPQAGAHRRLLAGGAFAITSSANLVLKGIPVGQSYTCAAGDEIEVHAETTTKFRVTVHKGDGTAMTALFGAFSAQLYMNASGTFTARKTGWHRITLSGSGARGGIAVGPYARATGGSAPGVCIGMRFLIAGQTYMGIVGASVASAAIARTSATVVAGANGNASSFSGTGITTMTANGGVAGAGAQGAPGTLAGSPGGTATGGDINITGAASGDATTSGNVSALAATGGSVAGILGTSFKSGDANSSAAFGAATGGAGVGAGSGNATATTSQTSSAGGGFGGPSAAATNTQLAAAGANFQGTAGGNAVQFGTAQFVVYTLLNATAGGATGEGVTANAGGGSGGVAQLLSSGNSIFMGGTGGLTYAAGSSNVASGNAGVGGSSGGVAVTAGPANTATAGSANTGFILIEY